MISRNEHVDVFTFTHARADIYFFYGRDHYSAMGIAREILRRFSRWRYEIYAATTERLLSRVFPISLIFLRDDLPAKSRPRIASFHGIVTHAQRLRFSGLPFDRVSSAIIIWKKRKLSLPALHSVQSSPDRHRSCERIACERTIGEVKKSKACIPISDTICISRMLTREWRSPFWLFGRCVNYWTRRNRVTAQLSLDDAMIVVSKQVEYALRRRIASKRRLAKSAGIYQVPQLCACLCDLEIEYGRCNRSKLRFVSLIGRTDPNFHRNLNGDRLRDDSEAIPLS